MKFGRIYSMLVDGDTQQWKIDFPLTCKFQVQNDTTFTYGSATFQIINLAADARSDIYQDVFQLDRYRQVRFAAGYESEGGALAQIFQGNILQAYSYRQGADWITEIQCLDGGFAGDHSAIFTTLASNYTLRFAIQKMMDAMSPTVKVGLIGDIDLPAVANTRGLTISGNPWDLIVRTAIPKNLLAFIYQEKVYVLRQDEFIEERGSFTEISEATGMLGTPKLQFGQVMAQMIFEPRIQTQQEIQLVTLESRMSGRYTVSRVVHRGTISGAVCDNLITEVTLYNPNRVLVAA